MIIQWQKVFLPYKHPKPTTVMKFTSLPSLIPWTMDKQTNIWATVEWLYRDGKNDKIRLCQENTLNYVRDNWFKAELEDGLFVHCCYPEEILFYRREYENLLQAIQGITPYHTMNLIQVHDQSQKARQILWSAWNCLGADGRIMKYEDVADEFKSQFDLPYSMWPRNWKKKCSRCCDPLPKSLQVWVKLQHSKLKEANN